MESPSAKVTAGLAKHLDESDDGMVDVVVELRSTPIEDGPGSRASRIAVRKRAFDDDVGPLEALIRETGGEVMDKAWLNQTIRARVPVEVISRLSSIHQVALVDVPRRLEPETG